MHRRDRRHGRRQAAISYIGIRRSRHVSRSHAVHTGHIYHRSHLPHHLRLVCDMLQQQRASLRPLIIHGKLCLQHTEVKKSDGVFPVLTVLAWDASGFSATRPYASTANGITHSAAGEHPQLDFTVSTDVKNQVDLLRASADTDGRGGSAVKMEFGMPCRQSQCAPAMRCCLQR